VEATLLPMDDKKRCAEVKLWMLMILSELKREAVMKDVVSHIVARLKKIPSSNAPEDLGLDGSAFEEIAYQLQYGESVFWDLYEDITYTECEKAYYNLD
jgi:hypothetical protein